MLNIISFSEAVYPLAMLVIALASFISNAVITRKRNERFKREEMDKKVDTTDFEEFKKENRFEHSELKKDSDKKLDDFKNHVDKRIDDTQTLIIELNKARN